LSLFLGDPLFVLFFFSIFLVHGRFPPLLTSFLLIRPFNLLPPFRASARSQFSVFLSSLVFFFSSYHPFGTFGPSRRFSPHPTFRLGVKGIVPPLLPTPTQALERFFSAWSYKSRSIFVRSLKRTPHLPWLDFLLFP